MAEGLLKHLLGQCSVGAPAVVSSCGTGGFVDIPATKEAVQVMSEAGIDISSHRSRPLTPTLLRDADLVLVMSGRHLHHIEMLYPEYASKAYLLREYASENPAFFSGNPDISDPIGRGIEAYRDVYRVLKESLERLCGKLDRPGRPGIGEGE